MHALAEYGAEHARVPVPGQLSERLYALGGVPLVSRPRTTS